MRKLRKQSERNNNPPTPIKLIPAKREFLFSEGDNSMNNILMSLQIKKIKRGTDTEIPLNENNPKLPVQRAINKLSVEPPAKKRGKQEFEISKIDIQRETMNMMKLIGENKFIAAIIRYHNVDYKDIASNSHNKKHSVNKSNINHKEKTSQLLQIEHDEKDQVEQLFGTVIELLTFENIIGFETYHRLKHNSEKSKRKESSGNILLDLFRNNTKSLILHEDKNQIIDLLFTQLEHENLELDFDVDTKQNRKLDQFKVFGNCQEIRSTEDDTYLVEEIIHKLKCKRSERGKTLNSTKQTKSEAETEKVSQAPEPPNSVKSPIIPISPPEQHKEEENSNTDNNNNTNNNNNNNKLKISNFLKFEDDLEKQLFFANQKEMLLSSLEKYYKETQLYVANQFVLEEIEESYLAQQKADELKCHPSLRDFPFHTLQILDDLKRRCTRIDSLGYKDLYDLIYTACKSMNELKYKKLYRDYNMKGMKIHPKAVIDYIANLLHHNYNNNR